MMIERTSTTNSLTESNAYKSYLCVCHDLAGLIPLLFPMGLHGSYVYTENRTGMVDTIRSHGRIFAFAKMATVYCCIATRSVETLQDFIISSALLYFNGTILRITLLW